MAKILIVDDESDMRTVLFHSLRPAGHQVVEAGDGEEALKKIKRTRFDLVVLDIMMPRMSGYDVLAKIREMPSRSDTPVIIVTAKHDPEGVLREATAGADEHIAKPFTPSELGAVVERALTERGVPGRRKNIAAGPEVYNTVDQLRRQLDNT